MKIDLKNEDLFRRFSICFVCKQQFCYFEYVGAFYHREWLSNWAVAEYAGMDLKKEKLLIMAGKRFSKLAFEMIDLFLFLLFLCSKAKFLFSIMTFFQILFSRHLYPMRNMQILLQARLFYCMRNRP